MGRIAKPVIIDPFYMALLSEYLERGKAIIDEYRKKKNAESQKKALIYVRAAEGLICAIIDPRSNPWDETLGTTFLYRPNFEFDGFDSEDDEISYKLNLMKGLLTSVGRCRVTDIDPLLEHYFGNHTDVCYDVAVVPDDIRGIIANVTDELYPAYISGNASEDDVNKATSLFELLCYIDNRFSYSCLKPLSIAERFSYAIDNNRDFNNMFACLFSVKLWGVVKVVYNQTGDRIYTEDLHASILDIKPDWSSVEMLNN